jgi:hypothetical protein
MTVGEQVNNDEQFWNSLLQFDNPDCIEQFSPNHPDYAWGNEKENTVYGKCDCDPSGGTKNHQKIWNWATLLIYIVLEGPMLL